MRHTTTGQTRPFNSTFERKFTPRPYPVPGATINGRPAWQVAAERKAIADARPTEPASVPEELPSTANVVARLIGGGMLVFIVLALLVGTVSVLSPARPLCSEDCR